MAAEYDVTQLLSAHRHGDRNATERLFELVYDELHQLAQRQLRWRRPGNTINTTGLVHEAYLKMFDRSELALNDRVHFFAVTATAMRQILVDRARRMKADKRGAGAPHTLINTEIMGDGQPFSVDILDLDDALVRLAGLNERLARVVEMRFFTGLNIDEIAEVLGVTTRTVDRDWYKAKAFLYLALTEKDERSDDVP